MPLHRLESSSSKTLSIRGMDCNVKERYMHSRERITLFTTVSSSASQKPPRPEFVFKGKGIRVMIENNEQAKVQWSDSGSYRLENVLQTVSNLIYLSE